MKYHRKKRLLGIVVWIIMGCLVLIGVLPSQVFGQVTSEVIRPIPSLDGVVTRNIKTEMYCYVGYNGVDPIIQINGQRYKIETTRSVSPLLSLLDSKNVNFGCSIRGIDIEYSQIDDLKNIEPSLTINNVAYNGLKFKSAAISAGYQYPALKDKLVLGLGLGYSVNKYTPLVINTTASTITSSGQSFVSGGFLLSGNVKYLINHFVNVELRLIKALSNDSFLSGANRLGINFMVGF